MSQLGHRYHPFQGTGTVVEEGTEGCQSQKSGMTGMKQCLINMIGVLHS